MLTLLWQEYRAAHPDGYGYTWFCEHFAAFERRTSATFRNRHAAGAVMQTDYAGQTVPVIDPATGAIYPAQIFVAVLGASNLTFAFAMRPLPPWPSITTPPSCRPAAASRATKARSRARC